MSLKSTFIIFLFLSLVSFSKLQAQIVLTAGMAEGYAGTTVCIDVEVTGLTDISSFEFGIAYDTLIAKATEVNLTDVFDSNEFTFINSSTTIDNKAASEIRFLGVINSADETVIDYNVPNGGGVVAEVCFELVGEPGEMAFLDFSYTGNEITFTQDLGSDGTFLFDYITNFGKLTILPDDDDIGIVTNVCAESFEVLNDGSVSFMATPGLSTTPPYNYEITDAGGTTLASGTGLTGEANNLSSGVYTVTITDSSTPPIEKSIDVNVALSPTIVVDATINQPICPNSRGSIAINSVTGGIENYKIRWESTNNDLVKYGQVTLSSAPEGEYILTLTNDDGCEYTELYTVEAPEPIRLENIEITRDCYDTDAIITGDIVGGTLASGGEYRMDVLLNDQHFGGSPSGINIDLTISDLIIDDTSVDVDSISIRIRDSNNCSTDTILYLPRPAEITLDTSTIISCEGNQATVIASGGSGDYTYIWSHDSNETGSMATGLPAGTTSVRVEDEKGCTATISYYFDNVSTGNINFDIVTTPVSCYEDTDGTATITVDDETEWTISWYNDIGLTDEIHSLSGQFSASGLASGIYYVSAFNNTLSCPVEEEVVINTPTQLGIIVDNIDDITCGDETNGSIKVTGTGGNSSGTPLYIFEITNGTSTMTGESVTFNNLGAGDYTITMTDESGCMMDSVITVGQDNPMMIELDATRTAVKSCNREFGTFAVTVTGGQEPYSYAWTRNGTFFTTTTEDQLTDLDSGTYKVSVTDDTGCRVELDTILTIEDVQAISFGVDYEEPGCFGEKTCITPTNIQGGTGDNYSIQVDFGNVLPIGDCVEVFAGSHSVVIIDGDNCASEEYEIFIDQPEEIIVDAGEDIEVNLGESSEEISVSIMSQNAIEQIIWSPDLNLEYITLDSQVVVSTPSDDIEYTITVIDDQGCTASDALFIDVNKSRRIPMANIFNPNGNGNNDFFSIQLPSSVTNISNMKIYDRWGNTVYDESDLLPNNGFVQGWDGKTDGNFVNPGVYVWMAQFEFIDGHTTTRSGSITVVR